MSIELSIPNSITLTSPPNKPYTAYTISIRQPLRTYTLQKRYSDFVTLHDALTAQTSSPPPASLPPKTWLKSTTSNPALAEERRQTLEQYLLAINTSSDARWRNAAAWRTFLNLPAKAGAAKAANTTGRITAMSATIVDPTVWLDVHRDLRGQLREGRQALARREAASSPQAQHEASADVKSALIKAGAMMVALQGGLKTMSGSSEGSKKGAKGNDDAPPIARLGEGELRRRKDLLASAQKEKDSIEEGFNASVSRQHKVDGAGGVESSKGDKESLLQPQQNGSKSHRVLGAAKETERTRQLDNQGVMQLQQEIMKEQDEDVTSLTKVVHRMKEMGVQINDELELQKGIIDVIDDDATRLEGKLAVSKKRINKIK